MTQARYFSSTAIPTTLSLAITNSATSIEVPLITGLPTSYPYTVVIDWGVYTGTTLTQEAVLVTQAPTGTGPYTFANVTRGIDGTTAQAHNAGATFVHTFLGQDGNDFQNHEVAEQSWISVKSYGATGNGTTDDTTAIQAAITAAEALTLGGSAGGVVYFPYGEYKISSVLTIASANITLIGDGGGGEFYGYPVKIIQTSTTANGLTVNNAWKISIRGIAFAGPGSGTGVGISMTYSPTPPCGFNGLEDVYVTGFGSHGIEVNEPVMSTFNRVWCEGNGGYGMYLTGGGTTCSFNSCWMSANLTGGWWINGNYHAFNACGADGNTGHGWTLSGAQSCNISGSGSEDNTGYGIYFTSSCLACTVNGFWVWNRDIGLQIDASCYGITIAGFMETVPSGATPTYSIACANGSITTLITPNVITATSLPTSYCNQIQNNGFYSGTFQAHGLTGATAAGRWVGAIASGTTPASGTFLTGDWVTVLTGGISVCSAGGTPGTWSGGGGGGLSTSLMTTPGDIIYENATPTAARLPIGASGQVLTVSGGLPVWAAAGSASLPWYNVKTYGATGNGSTDDSTDIQAALTACRVAGGGIVKVPAGTYIVGQILQIGSNTWLIGDGKGATTIRAKTNMDPTVIGNTAGITVLQVYNEAAASNITIEGITFDGNEAGNLNIDVVTGGTLTGGGTATSQLSPVIRIDQVDKLLIRGCEFINSILYNIWLNACTRFTITENTILAGQVTETAAGSGVTVNSNNTYGNQDGVHCTNCQYGVISNNIIDTGTLWQVGDDAVFLQTLPLATNGGAAGGGGGPAATTDIVVTGNTIRSAARGCAMACNGPTATVSNVTISGNTIWATLSDGIMLTQDTLDTGGVNRNITIVGNTICNTNYESGGTNAGITLMAPWQQSSTGQGWQDVNINGNTFVGFGGASTNTFIYATMGSGLKITDNIFDTMPAICAIQIGDNPSGTSYPVTNFVIANNMISLTSSTYADLTGILIIDSQNGTVNGNTLIGNGNANSTGIQIKGYVSGSLPSGISVIGNSVHTWGIAIAEVNGGATPNYNLFDGNNCHSNTNFIDKLGANSVTGSNVVA